MRASLGGSAKVLSSSGFHSKKYIGEVGYAVQHLGDLWVLRFPSVFPKMEEGLFNKSELKWVK
jgi:hypothetical protein